ncbi:hypothetical protein NEFER03_1142 [Nematocida sp. LUAm3]|nr:hypothetical protein NEFER03_1142 [Nematocida sp. LUAm3]KAI5176322.1 hypothetical protein NEFER02_2110 [Nematocida sp. LUAm2]KAI5178247.1 hypothetical protein NEFER01_1414 [Nematocida sp. LUAm1]
MMNGGQNPHIFQQGAFGQQPMQKQEKPGYSSMYSQQGMPTGGYPMHQMNMYGAVDDNAPIKLSISAINSTKEAYKPHIRQEGTRIQAITATPIYKHQTIEEIRAADYCAGRQGTLCPPDKEMGYSSYSPQSSLYHSSQGSSFSQAQPSANTGFYSNQSTTSSPSMFGSNRFQPSGYSSQPMQQQPMQQQISTPSYFGSTPSNSSSMLSSQQRPATAFGGYSTPSSSISSMQQPQMQSSSFFQQPMPEMNKVGTSSDLAHNRPFSSMQQSPSPFSGTGSLGGSGSTLSSAQQSPFLNTNSLQSGGVGFGSLTSAQQPTSTLFGGQQNMSQLGGLNRQDSSFSPTQQNSSFSSLQQPSSSISPLSTPTPSLSFGQNASSLTENRPAFGQGTSSSLGGMSQQQIQPNTTNSSFAMPNAFSGFSSLGSTQSSFDKPHDQQQANKPLGMGLNTTGLGGGLGMGLGSGLGGGLGSGLGSSTGLGENKETNTGLGGLGGGLGGSSFGIPQSSSMSKPSMSFALGSGTGLGSSPLSFSQTRPQETSSFGTTAPQEKNNDPYLITSLNFEECETYEKRKQIDLPKVLFEKTPKTKIKFKANIPFKALTTQPSSFDLYKKLSDESDEGLLQFYTSPPTEQLRKMKEKGGKVSGLVIGRKGKGKIEYQCEIDLAQVNLDTLQKDVEFLKGEVRIYKGRDVDVGVGLNNTARIYIEDMFLYSKSIGERILDEKNLGPMRAVRDYIVKKATEDGKATLVEYRLDIGTLILDCKHF